MSTKSILAPQYRAQFEDATKVIGEVHTISPFLTPNEIKEFVNQFENSVNSITLIDIPNQEGSISKEEFKKKLGNKNIHTAESIEESLLMNNKDKNCIFLCAGSLYLAGEVLNLN